MSTGQPFSDFANNVVAPAEHEHRFVCILVHHGLEDSVRLDDLVAVDLRVVSDLQESLSMTPASTHLDAKLGAQLASPCFFMRAASVCQLREML